MGSRNLGFLLGDRDVTALSVHPSAPHRLRLRVNRYKGMFAEFSDLFPFPPLSPRFPSYSKEEFFTSVSKLFIGKSQPACILVLRTGLK